MDGLYIAATEPKTRLRSYWAIDYTDQNLPSRLMEEALNCNAPYCKHLAVIRFTNDSQLHVVFLLQSRHTDIPQIGSYAKYGTFLIMRRATTTNSSFKKKNAIILYKGFSRSIFDIVFFFLSSQVPQRHSWPSRLTKGCSDRKPIEYNACNSNCRCINNASDIFGGQ